MAINKPHHASHGDARPPRPPTDEPAREHQFPLLAALGDDVLYSVCLVPGSIVEHHDDRATLAVVGGIGRDITDQMETSGRVRASEAGVRELLSAIDLGALVLDTTFRVVFVNDYLLRLLELSRTDVIGRDWFELAVPEPERPGLRRALEVALAAGTGTGSHEEGLVTRSGSERRLRWTSAIQHDAEGRVVGLAGIAHDVTEFRAAEAERARLAAAIEQSAESVVITDCDARIVYVNRAFERLSGYTAAEAIGQNPRMVKSGLQPASFYAAMWAALSNGLPWVADVVNRRKDGSLYYLNSVTSPIRGTDGEATGYVAVGRDVSHERALESQAERLTRERALIAETLRSLPSGGDVESTAELFCRQVASLTDIVVASLVAFESEASAIPLAYVSPDPVRLGLHPLSIEESRYLYDHGTSGPWVEEWSGGTSHPYDGSITRAGVRAIAFAPVRSNGSLVGLLAIGSAQPDAVQQLSERLGGLVDFADLAGALLGPRLADRTEARQVRSEIEAVIADRAFSTVFQPIVDMRHGRTVGHEALTRFADGARPEVRFAGAAAAGLGLELEQATLEAALAAHQGHLSPSLWLHLNVSAELVATRSLGPLLRDVRARIVLEITEHDAIHDYAAFREAIAAIGRPVQLAVDDAGAGFASLRHILELQPTFVKLDQSLIRGIDTDPAKQALVTGMGFFARATRRHLIAEGVETATEAEQLHALGVRLAQGFLFGRPTLLG